MNITKPKYKPFQLFERECKRHAFVHIRMMLWRCRNCGEEVYSN